MKELNKKNAKLIFGTSLKLRNRSFAIAAVGLMLYNIFPNTAELSCWMLGAGIALGSYVHFRIKKQMEVLLYGTLLKENPETSEVIINGICYSFPSNKFHLVCADDNTKFFTIAVVTSPSATVVAVGTRVMIPEPAQIPASGTTAPDSYLE